LQNKELAAQFDAHPVPLSHFQRSATQGINPFVPHAQLVSSILAFGVKLEELDLVFCAGRAMENCSCEVNC